MRLVHRVIVGLGVLLLLMGGSLSYILWRVDGLLDLVGTLKDHVEPLTVQARSLAFQLKAVDDNLSTGRQSGLERGAELFERSRFFARLEEIAGGLERAEGSTVGWPRPGKSSLVKARTWIDSLLRGKDLVPPRLRVVPLCVGQEAFRGNLEYTRALVSCLRSRIDSRDRERAARELLRVVRAMRARLLSVTRVLLRASRAVSQELSEQRSGLSYVVVIVAAAAVILGLWTIVFVAWGLAPAVRLAEAIRRIGEGQYDAPIPGGLTGELGDIGRAVEHLAAALRSREAEVVRNRDELARAERLALVGRMASVVAHEVRNPLNSIALNVSLLAETLEERGQATDKAMKTLNAIRREVDRLEGITDEYLKFGRLPRAVLSPVDVVAVVRDVLAFVSGELEAAHIRVEATLSSASPMALADEAQLRQALLNIVKNSREAMQGGGTIFVAVQANPRGNVVVEIRDTGPGIPDEIMEDLFEPFATTKPGGTGLGLAFVRQVMHESGGDVLVESQRGRGTTVRLILKMAQGEASK